MSSQDQPSSLESDTQSSPIPETLMVWDEASGASEGAYMLTTLRPLSKDARKYPRHGNSPLATMLALGRLARTVVAGRTRQ